MSGASYGADGTITYNFGDIADVATAIGTYTGAMEGALDELYQQFRTTLANDWTGKAGEACDQAREQWSKGMDVIKEALFHVGQRLGAAGSNMEAVENAIAASMG
jgi:WXG100 family type VII secretion target